MDKERFVLALQGWKFQGTLEEWCYGPSDPPTASNPSPLPAPYHGHMGNLAVMLPGNIIKEQRTTDKGTYVFLTNSLYYKLGNKRKWLRK